MAQIIHPFEAAGLGVAPFRFVGCTENVFVAHPGATPKAGGTCDYCSNGIRYEFHVQGADGRKFKVGCDCIRKVSSPGEKLLTASERAMRQAQKAAKRAALLARGKAALDAMNANETLFAGRPHPAVARWTYRSYLEFLLTKAGDKGMLNACKIVEAAVKVAA